MEHMLEFKKFNSKEGSLTSLLKVSIFKLSFTISNNFRISETDNIFLNI